VHGRSLRLKPAPRRSLDRFAKGPQTFPSRPQCGSALASSPMPSEASVEQGGRWEKAIEGANSFARLAVIDGVLYVPDNRGGLYAHEDGVWRKMLENAGRVFAVAKIDRWVIASTASGAYLRKKSPGRGSQWKRIFRPKVKIWKARRHEKTPRKSYGTYGVFAIGGEVYAIADSGLYRRLHNDWKKWQIVDEKVQAKDMIEIDGTIYLPAFNDGGTLYVLDSKNLTVEKIYSGGLENVKGIGKIEGQLYAYGGNGLFVLGPKGMGNSVEIHDGAEQGVQDFAVKDGNVYLGAWPGIMRWPLNAFDVRPNWRQRLLADLERQIGKNRQSAEVPNNRRAAERRGGMTQALSLSPDGTALTGKSGRAIFTGLGRIFSWVGNQSLNFGSPETNRRKLKRTDESPNKQLWSKLERWVTETANLKSAKSRANAWREGAAQLLYNQPGLPLGQVLAEAFSKAHSLMPKQGKSILGVLTHRPIRERSLPQDWEDWGINQIDRIGNKIYAATGNGLYEQDGDGWRLALENVGEVYHFRAEGDRILAGTAKGLFLWENGAWKHWPITRKELRVYRIVRLQGTLYAATDKGLFRHTEAGWEKETLWGVGWVDRIAEAGGTLYAGTDNGLFWKGADGKWHKQRMALSTPHVVDIAEENGIPFILSHNTLYQRVQNKLVPVLQGFGTGFSLGRIHGRLHAGTNNGLYVLAEGGQWKRLPFGIENVGIIGAMDETVYLNTETGLFRWIPSPPELPKDWQERFMTELTERIEYLRAVKATSKVHKALSLSADGGSVLGQGGRVLFSGLRLLARRAGNARLGFGRASHRSSHALWQQLEEWVADEPGIQIKKPRAAQWRAETAKILRSTPEMELHRALAQALSDTHGLVGRASRRAQLLLHELVTGTPVPIPFHPDNPSINQIEKIDGTMFIATDDGLYIEDQNGFTLVLSGEEPVYSILQDNEKRILALIGGDLHVYEGGAWRKSSLHKGLQRSVSAIFRFQGEIYAATDKGLFRRTKAGWKTDGLWDSRSARLRQILKLGKTLYAATDKDLYEKEPGGRWRKTFRQNVRGIEIVDNTLFIRTPADLYRKTAQGFEPVLTHVSWVHWVGRVGDVLMAGTNTGLHPISSGSIPVPQGLEVVRAWKNDENTVYISSRGRLLRWRLKNPGMDLDWRKRLKADLEAKIDADLHFAESRDEPKEALSLTPDGTALIGKSGRALFTGLRRLREAIGNQSLGFGKVGTAGKRHTANQELRKQPRNRRSNPWQALKRALGREFGNKASSIDPEDWKNQTAQIFRQMPSLSLEQALAHAWADLLLLDQKTQSRAAQALAGNLVELEFPVGIGSVRQIAKFGRTLYAATNQALYEKTATRSEAILPHVGPVHQIVKIQGKLFAATHSGLYMRKGKRWTRVIPQWKKGRFEVGGVGFALAEKGLYKYYQGQWEDILGLPEYPLFLKELDGTLYAQFWGSLFVRSGGAWKRKIDKVGLWMNDVLKLDGILYAISRNGMFVQKGGRWTQVIESEVHRIAKIDGVLYAAAEDGVYTKTDKGWKLLHQTSLGSVYKIIQINGKLYFPSSMGLFVLENGRLRKLLSDLAYNIIKLNGRHYAIMKKGVYVEQNGLWKKILEIGINSPGSFLNVDGRLYLGTQDGVWRWPLGPAQALQRNRKALLEDVNLRIGALRSQRDNGKQADENLSVSQDGSIIGSGDRALFTSLRRFFPGPGNQSLHFGSPETNRRLPNSLWQQLEEWVADEIGIQIEKPRAAQWREKTAKILRSTPELELHRALARALSDTHGLVGRASRRAQLLLQELVTGTPVPIPLHPNNPFIYQIEKIDEKMFIATDFGLYIADENGVPLVSFGAGPVYSVLQDNEKRILALRGNGLHVYEGGAWRKSRLYQGLKRHVSAIFRFEGEVYAATNKGLFRRTKAGWKKDGLWGSRTARPRHILKLGKTLYAATDKGLYEREPGGRWRKTFMQPAIKIAIVDNALFIMSSQGLYRKTAQGLEPVLTQVGRVHWVGRVGDVLMAGTDTGIHPISSGSIPVPQGLKVASAWKNDGNTVYIGSRGRLLRWRLKIPGMDLDWRKRLKADLEAKINADLHFAESRDELKQALSITTDGTALIGKSGRALFTGLGRLREALGNQSLGFGEVAPAAKQHTANPEMSKLWRDLERWAQDALEFPLLRKAEPDAAATVAGIEKAANIGP